MNGILKRIFGATLMLGLVAWSAVSVEAVEVRGPGDEVSNTIIVVNDYSESVRVYVEDAEGSLHHLGRVGRGEVKHFEAPADIWRRGDFRVRIHPIERDPWSKYVRIKTRALNIEDDETVVMWLKTDLAKSVLEVGQG